MSIRRNLLAALVAAAFVPAGPLMDQSGERYATGDETPVGYTQADTGDALQPGDMIRLRIWRDPGLNGDYLIDSDGSTILPLLGSRSVLGVGAETLKATLVAEYAKELRNQEPQIILLRRVRVLGEVNNPGLFHVDRTMTLGDVLALAGGVNEEGRWDGIRIVRQGSEVFSNLDASAPVADRIRSGDQIMVEKQGWLSRNAVGVIGATVSASAIIAAALIR